MNNENTVFDNEKSKYQGQDSEATHYDGVAEKKENSQSEAKTPETAARKKGKRPMWQKAAAGLAGGILLGTTAAVAAETGEDVLVDGGADNEEPNVAFDDDISSATSVNDDMSFAEAFAAAREEVGPGGVFEWHGNLYGTYTAEEWDSMSAEDRAEYNSHFSWSEDSSQGEVDTESTNSATNDIYEADEQVHNGVEEPVEVNVDENNGVEDHTATVDEPAVVPEDNITIEPVESDVEILGVVHDEESGMNIGGMIVDGQEVVLVDVDGDNVFDLMGADLDGNMELSNGEFIDISDAAINVSDMGGITNPDDGLYASSDEGMSYADDAGVYEA